MKKAIYILMACMSVAACEIYSNDYTDVDRNNIINYASKKFTDYVIAPVEITESLLAFDEYMQKSVEEQELDNRFYGRIDMVYDNIYSFKDTYQYAVHCTVDTKGRSLNEDGAVWTFAEASLYGMNDETFNYFYYGECSLPEFTQIAKTGADTWTISYEDMFEIELKYLGDDNGRKMWEVKTNGIQKSSVGAMSSFTTGNEPMTVKEMQMSNDGRYRGNAYGGTFKVETFNEDQEILDYCNIKFMPGFTTKFYTSQDL